MKQNNELFKKTIKEAEQGNANAQYNLAVIYHIGEKVDENYKEAIKWYTKAAKQGHSEAQKKLNQINQENE